MHWCTLWFKIEQIVTCLVNERGSFVLNIDYKVIQSRIWVHKVGSRCAGSNLSGAEQDASGILALRAGLGQRGAQSVWCKAASRHAGTDLDGTKEGPESMRWDPGMKSAALHANLAWNLTHRLAPSLIHINK